MKWSFSVCRSLQSKDIGAIERKLLWFNRSKLAQKPTWISSNSDRCGSVEIIISALSLSPSDRSVGVEGDA